MRQKLGAVLKCALFPVILALCLYSINGVLQPKYYLHDNTWPSTATFRQFYQMDRNSVDVLILGSSVALNHFIPQKLYDDYGIRAYNLSSEQQSVMLSYYWLKEALRYQTPKVVVLEGYFLQDIHPESPVNTVEGLARKAVDPMRLLSPVKAEAVRDICARDPSQRALSYYLTNLRYHDRWKSLREDDFSIAPELSPRLYGWAPGREEPVPVHPFAASDADTSYELRGDMVGYFEKAAELCRKKGIELILVRTPQRDGIAAPMDYAYRQLAERCGVDYYNFLEQSLFERLGADTTRECVDNHGNLKGNIKNTALLGNILSENYGLQPHPDPQYESTRAIYREICATVSFPKTDDIDEYLALVGVDPDFSVLIAVCDDAAIGLRASTRERLSALGLNNDWGAGDMPRCAYVAIVDGGQVSEARGEPGRPEPLTLAGKLRDEGIPYIVRSSGFADAGGAMCSIQLDGQEYAVNSRGLNIVVYDATLHAVVDSVCFDIFDGSIATRGSRSAQ